MNRSIWLSLAVHVGLLWAPFDIYFVSPIIHGMTPVKSEFIAPAKRVVLISADGLRAEAIYGNLMKNITPFLTKVKEKKGSWGVAHTRVPTESRPGHVALLAGIYEDPSAILHGWKINPIHFDTVINQSRNAWCWGSPDIVTMFNKDNSPHIQIEAYDSAMEDFGKSDTIKLDSWVLDKVSTTLNDRSKQNCGNLCQDGNVFFLHLLGIDTAGHAYKPYSSMYNNNIRYVDSLVSDVERLFENFFADEATAYIFTSDHGMTNWGSHGAGTAHETEVPFIAWGAGIKRNNKRQDLNQADVASLMSVLIGRNIPVNSVGTVPHMYLEVDEETLVNMVYTNVKQLLELYNVKRKKYEDTLSKLIYKPFTLTDSLINYYIVNISDSVKKYNFQKALSDCLLLIKDVHRGLDYYQTYFQMPLLISLSLGLFLWILYLIVNTPVINQREFAHVDLLIIYSKIDLLRKKCRLYVYGSVAVALYLTAVFVYAQSLPFMYWIYFSFPFVVTALILLDLHKVYYTMHCIRENGIRNSIYVCIFCTVIVEFLVQGFLNSLYFSAIMVIVGCWVFVSKEFRGNKISWLSVNLILASFIALPVMNTKFNIFWFLLGAMAWLLVLTRVRFHLYYKNLWRDEFSSPSLLMFQLAIFAFACMNSLMVAYTFYIDEGLYLFNQIISWIVLAQALVTPFLMKMYIYAKMFSITLALVSVYVLLTVNYETLFILCFSLLMYQWMNMEYILTFNDFKSWSVLQNLDFSYRKDSVRSDIRLALFYLTFIMVGFFGTGNIASLNSFDPMWVRCFITVFSPFTMFALILLKLIIPFLLVTCTFRMAVKISQRKHNYSIHIILILSDVMLCHFLHYIRNEGSWLDIGTSLSHYFIFEFISIIYVMLYGTACLLTSHGSMPRKVLK